ncbi:helix-turn-helix domain-containing protein [Empedobacter brevis]|uniref:helix-turn-helix domain-containing protein n=1 Tax=Empedobacter brevis TaxID=247 RepID=UPI0028A6499B|nr:helix-turn-helix transcriptional regulator [Empedobacter brevis]
MTKDKLKKELGKRIVQLREKKGWSQSDLARACHKDRQVIEKLESGKVNPTLYTLLEIANALEVSLSKLVDLA